MLDAFWIRLAWCQMCQVSVTVVVVWLLVQFCARHRPQLAYLLWMLVVMKCITPPVWGSPWGLFSSIPYISGSIASLPPTVGVTNREKAIWAERFEISKDLKRIEYDSFAVSPSGPGLSTVVESTLSWIRPQTIGDQSGQSSVLFHAMASLWLFGVGAIIICLTWKWTTFCRSLRNDPGLERIETQVKDLAARLALRRIPRVVYSSVSTVPAVFGFFRPTIVLPDSLLSLENNVDLEPILAHELVHFRRADTLAGRIQILVQAIWWFHPLVWWANFETRRERERSCDEMVIALMGYAPLRYANSLISIAECARRSNRGEPSWQLVGVAAVGSFRLLVNRLEHITAHARIFRSRAQLHDILTALLLAAVLLPGAANSIFHANSLNTTSNSTHAKPNELIAGRDRRRILVSNDVVHDRPFVHAPRVQRITIDGKLDDWPSTMPRHAFTKILASGAQSWEGTDFSTSADLSCAFMVGYNPDEQLLYVSVIVRDDKVVIGHDSDRDTDAIELYVDGLRSRRTYPSPGERNRLWYEKADLRGLPVQQYCAIPGDGPIYGSSKKSNPLLIAGELEKTRTTMAFTQSDGILVYEWAVQVFDQYPDRATRLEPGKRIGFEIVVVDKDVPLVGPVDDEPEIHRRAWVYWGPNWSGTKVLDAGSLGEIVLGE